MKINICSCHNWLKIITSGFDSTNKQYCFGSHYTAGVVQCIVVFHREDEGIVLVASFPNSHISYWDVRVWEWGCYSQGKWTEMINSWFTVLHLDKPLNTITVFNYVFNHFNRLQLRWAEKILPRINNDSSEENKQTNKQTKKQNLVLVVEGNFALHHIICGWNVSW